MKIEENIIKVLKRGFLCDHCLGRLWSQLLSGFSNEERGKIIRKYIAFLIDSGEKIDVDMSNFYEIKFKNVKIESKKPIECIVCKNIFQSIDEIAKNTVKKLKKIEFNNFLVGSTIPDSILNIEETIWSEIGINYVESIKSEINRELGKKLGSIIKKPVNFKNPDVLIIADFKKNNVEIVINSLYILGYYKKLKRGIPQCKWGTPGKYKTSVQEIIAKPLMKVTKGISNKFSGSGREDIDARCLDWRPFVIEIIKPKIRKINFRKIEKQINKSRKVKVKGLKVSNKFTVRRIKSETGDKTYKALVKFKKPVKKQELKKLKSLIGIISQRTPQRVVHRRADLIRKRSVKDIKYKQINKKTIELKIKTSAGLYIKELITGDKGRTKPSVSDILDNEAIPKNLDVIKIEKPKNL